jgi:PIN domain nuclease of toxin-antitoxin system
MLCGDGAAAGGEARASGGARSLDRQSLTYLLDTHVWIWAANADRRLPRPLGRLLAAAGRDELGLLDISLWEAGRVHRARQLTSGDPSAWFARALAHVVTLPLAPDIVLAEQALAWPHRDPADRLIVSAALVRGLRVLTVDQVILDCGLVATG